MDPSKLLKLRYLFIFDAFRMLTQRVGSPVQKGITAYAMSSNKQRPLAGALNAAMSNTFRRSSKQFLYVVPPFVVAYMAMTWAIERCVLELQSRRRR